MKSIHIIDGDFAVDSRGKVISTSGHQKVSNQVNYVLNNSAYLTTLTSSSYTNSPSANEFALKDAVSKTIQELISTHSRTLGLPTDERIKKITNLDVTRYDNTSYEFLVQVQTVKGSQFSLGISNNY